MMKKIQYRTSNKQQGAVSLFVVIFTTLLITAITISFLQLMVKDQRQATYSDLSQSAYDSAVAGVEDAKRALLMQQDCQGNSSQRCADIRAALSSGQCATLAAIFGGSVQGETEIAQSEGDRALKQAYTCVKVTQDTADYIGSIDANSAATLVPLRGKGAFNKVVVSWGLNKSGGPIDLSSGSRDLPARGTATWPESRPALLRAQLINGQGSFHLSDLDASGYSNTLFMYPSSTGVTTAAFALDGRRGASNGEPQLVSCSAMVASGAYACQVTIDITPAIAAGSQTAFLNLGAFYARTDYKVELRNDTTAVLFDGIQPEVDSTGRANDLFRRVVSRVELNNTFNYPIAALEARNNICKNFSVTTELDDYVASPQCRPTDSN